MSQAPRVMRSWLALVVVVWPLGAVGAEEAVRFQYAALATCPDVDAFTARVRERTARARWATPGELARTFRVAITEDAHGFLGRIEFLDDAGADASRSVRGEQCDAVVTSLALITALALDAALHEEAPVSPSPAAPRPRPEPARPSTKPEPPLTRRAIAPPPRAITSLRIGVAGGYAGDVRAPSLGLLGQLDFRGGWSLRLDAHYGWDDFVADDQERRARLRTQGVQTSVCPWRYGPRELVVAPCALVDLGYLYVAGVRDDRLTSARGEGIFWGAVGAELRLGWEPRAPFWAEVRVAGVVPLRQNYRFTFDNPNRDAYLAPPFAVSAGLAGGVRFW